MSEQAFTNKKFSDEEKIDLLVLLAIILTTLENISENDVGLMMSLYKEIIKTSRNPSSTSILDARCDKHIHVRAILHKYCKMIELYSRPEYGLVEQIISNIVVVYIPVDNYPCPYEEIPRPDKELSVEESSTCIRVRHD